MPEKNNIFPLRNEFEEAWKRLNAAITALVVFLDGRPVFEGYAIWAQSIGDHVIAALSSIDNWEYGVWKLTNTENELRFAAERLSDLIQSENMPVWDEYAKDAPSEPTGLWEDTLRRADDLANEVQKVAAEVCNLYRGLGHT